jgi:hypothetical protein
MDGLFDLAAGLAVELLRQWDRRELETNPRFRTEVANWTQRSLVSSEANDGLQYSGKAR